MTKATLVRLTDEMLQRIDGLAGKNKRAEFVREAVEREIKRRERISRLSGASGDQDDGQDGD